MLRNLDGIGKGEEGRGGVLERGEGSIRLRGRGRGGKGKWRRWRDGGGLRWEGRVGVEKSRCGVGGTRREWGRVGGSRGRLAGWGCSRESEGSGVGSSSVRQGWNDG